MDAPENYEAEYLLTARRILFPAPIPENLHREADPISGPGVYMVTFSTEANSRYRQSMQKYCMLGFTDAGSLIDYIQKYYYNQDLYDLPGRAKVLKTQ